MTRHIDAEQYIKTVESFVQSKGYIIPSDITRLINNAPTIDAVEVVRCKNCILHFDYKDEIICNHLSGLVGCNVCVKGDDFCSYGERKTK